MLTLLLDLDGVCCPFDREFRLWYEEHHGVWLPESSVYDQYNLFIKYYLQQPGIFRDMPLVTGCYDVLCKHLPDYSYVVVTSRPPEHHADTLDWVNTQLPPVEAVIFTDSDNKHRVRGDVIIDDNPGVLSSFNGLPTITIKMAYGYNENIPTHFGAHSWQDVDSILTRLTQWF